MEKKKRAYDLKQNNMKKCPVCKKGTLLRKKNKETYAYKGQSIDVEQPAEWCDNCGEGILSGADIKATEKILHDFRANIDGFLMSDEPSLPIMIGHSPHDKLM